MQTLASVGEKHDRRKAGKCTDAPDDGHVDWNM
jgi:hypothetical protein